MLTKETPQQSEMEFVSIEDLVPGDHLLRKIDKAMDFRFIYEKVAGLYSPDVGRPSIDPVVLFKMLMIGYLFGIRSERQLVRDIEVNMAYRWFLGLGIRDKVPHHSTLSQNRRRRFKESTIYQEIFDAIVFKAIAKNMVDGRTLYTDSTHLRASANKNKFVRQEVERSTRNYLDTLDQDVARDRAAHGKKPLPPAPAPAATTKESKVSTTDPDSGYMMRDGKPEGFFYLDHRTVDGKHNIITDTYVTPGNVHDSVPYLDRLDHQRERFGLPVQAVGLDAGYYTTAICKGLSDRGLYGVMPYVRPGGKPGMLKKTKFIYDEHFDCYLCPQDHTLRYTTTDRNGYRQYKSDPEVCRNCPLLAQCTTRKTHTKIIQRHLWQEHKERVDDHRFEERGKAIYKRRKETVERSFADAKQLHGHRYARMRGHSRVTEQCLMTAACQNLKKIALHLARGPAKGLKSALPGLFALTRAPLRLARDFNRCTAPTPHIHQYATT